MGYKKYIKWLIPVAVLGAVLILGLVLGKAERTAKSEYSYTLTQEQAQNYQSAVCYLIKREGEDMYKVQYSDCGVTYADGTLQTKYDGMAVEITCPDERAFYPVLDLKGNAGETPQYIGAFYLSNDQVLMDGWDYLLELKEENLPEITAMKPMGEGTAEDMLAGGYREVSRLAEYREVFYYSGILYRPVYDAEGKLLPIQNWEATDYFSGWNLNLDQSLQMHYVPLVGGEYYLLYQITDTQGNTYCSELIPYRTEPRTQGVKKEPDLSVKWENTGREQLLLESDGIALYMTVVKNFRGESKYAIKVKNNTDRTIDCLVADPLLNGVVPCTVDPVLTVKPGKFVADESGFDFGIAGGSPELETLESLQFSLWIRDAETGDVLWQERRIQVDLLEAWPIARQNTEYFAINEPAMGALAKEQMLLETDVLRFTLLGAGSISSADGDLTMTFRLENLTQWEQEVQIAGVAINGIYEETWGHVLAPGGCVDYTQCRISSMADWFTGEIESLALLIETKGQEDWTIPSEERIWVPVVLEQAGTAGPFETGTIVWENESVQVGDRGFSWQLETWNMTLTNHLDQGVVLVAVDAVTGEKLLYGVRVGPNQKNDFGIPLPEGAAASEDGTIRLTVRFEIYDWDKNTMLCEESTEVVLEAK